MIFILSVSHYFFLFFVFVFFVFVLLLNGHAVPTLQYPSHSLQKEEKITIKKEK